MTATNHVLTGVLIVALVPNPLISLPLAFLAHFVLDALPHFGDTHNRAAVFKNLKYILAADMLIASAVLLAILGLQPANWPLLILGGVLCASPDLMWMPNYLRYLLHKPTKPSNWLMRFHTWIQWGERPWGILVELVWFASVGSVLLKVL